MEKKRIISSLRSLDASFFDADAQDIVRKVQEVLQFGLDQGFEGVSIEADCDMDGLYGYNVFAHRLETDEEFNLRVEKNLKAKASRAERIKKTKNTKKDKKYEEYLKLKKEFEG